MPYVRRRGSHLAIVHGARDPHTKKVEQQVLLTFHSKAEALAALGKTGDGRDRRMLQSWMERRHPDLRFQWPAIDERLDELKDELPDLAASRRERALGGGFRDSLVAFARHIMAADPDALDSARELLVEHRHDLDWLTELIDSRLESAARTEPSEWSRDHFGWRLALGTHEVDPYLEEEAAAAYERGEYERAERIFRLFVDAYPRYADGWNYLGLIALQNEDLEQARMHFETTEKVGRALFPKRIPKRDYWARLETRPYMRALRNQCIVLNRLARYVRVLEIAERLQHECGDDISAALFRAAVYLNTGEWQLAFDAATFVTGLYPNESLIAAFAAFELGRRDDARARFIHAMLNGPRTVGILLGKRHPPPRSHVEARDHNQGVAMHNQLGGFLAKQSPKSKAFFSRLWRDPELSRLREEVIDAETRRDQLGREEADLGRQLFDRLGELRSWEFAAAITGPRLREATS